MNREKLIEIYGADKVKKAVDFFDKKKKHFTIKKLVAKLQEIK